MPLDRLGLQAVGALDALQPHGGVDVEHDREVRDQIAGRPQAQIAYAIDAQFATGPLIGNGGVQEAVAHDDLATLQSGPDHPHRVITASGREQQRLGAVIEAGVGHIEQHLADRLSRRCPTWLAGASHHPALRLQPLGEQSRLGRLARTLTALEDDEYPALHGASAYAEAFLSADFVAVVFFAAVFLAAVFFAADFFAVVFLAGDFFAADFFAGRRVAFFTGPRARRSAMSS